LTSSNPSVEADRKLFREVGVTASAAAVVEAQ
jgi:hypothetical protein